MTAERETPASSISDSSSLSPGPLSNGRGGVLRTHNDSEAKPVPQQRPLYSASHRWLHRLSMLMFVFVTAVTGVLLVILPWRTEWMDNHFLMGSPGLSAFVANGFVRGLCSGLGLLDIWIGFSAAVNYTDRV